MKTKRLFVGVAGFIFLAASLMAVGAGLHSGIGYLGVSIRDVTHEDVGHLSLPAEGGVYVEGVENESPAEEAGLQDADVVLEYAGMRIFSVRQFQRVVSETPPGREIQMDVWRAGGSVGLSAKIGKRANYTWFGEGPEIRIEKEIIPGLRSGDHPFHIDGHDFHFAGRKPRLGVQGVPLTAQMAEFLGIPGSQGVLVLQVLPSTVAETAGFQAGDVILSVNGTAVEDPGELLGHLADGDNEIEFARNKKVSSVTVNLEGKKPKIDDALEL